MTTNSQERQFRIIEILKRISTKETPKNEVLGKIMFDWGVSKRTALEYLEVLLSAGFVQEGAGNVWKK